MPSLGQIKCSVELSDSNIALREFGTKHGDSQVSTYIALPKQPANFGIHLRVDGYISPGLAAYVYIDGVYQCNRNRGKFKPGSRSVNPTTFSFTGKEKLIGERLFTRRWRFDKLNIVQAEAEMDAKKKKLNGIGTIEVIVLRCGEVGGLSLNLIGEVEPLSFPRISRGHEKMVAAPSSSSDSSSSSSSGSKDSPDLFKSSSTHAGNEADGSDGVLGGLLGIFDGCVADVKNTDEIYLRGASPSSRHFGMDGTSEDRHGHGHDSSSNRHRRHRRENIHYTSNWNRDFTNRGRATSRDRSYSRFRGRRHHRSNSSSTSSSSTRHSHHRSGSRNRDDRYQKGSSSVRDPMKTSPRGMASLDGGNPGHGLYGMPSAHPHMSRTNLPSFPYLPYGMQPPIANGQVPGPVYLPYLPGFPQGHGHEFQRGCPNCDCDECKDQQRRKDSKRSKRSSRSRRSGRSKSSNAPRKNGDEEENWATLLANDTGSRNKSSWNATQGNDNGNSGNNGKDDFNGNNRGNTKWNNQNIPTEWADNNGNGNTGDDTNWNNQNTSNEWSGNNGNGNTGDNPSWNNQNTSNEWSGKNGNGNAGDNPSWTNQNAGNEWNGVNNMNSNSNGNGNGNGNWNNKGQNGGVSNIGSSWNNNNNQGNGGAAFDNKSDNNAKATSIWGKDNSFDKQNTYAPTIQKSNGTDSSKSNDEDSDDDNDKDRGYIKAHAKKYWRQQVHLEGSRQHRQSHKHHHHHHHHHRHRSPSINSSILLKEEEVITVPDEFAKSHGVEHQVRVGRAVELAKKPKKPDYWDSMDRPFAVFTFKYRSKETIEKVLEMNIEDSEMETEALLKSLSKEELIAMMMKKKEEDNQN